MALRVSASRKACGDARLVRGTLPERQPEENPPHRNEASRVGGDVQERRAMADRIAAALVVVDRIELECFVEQILRSRVLLRIRGQIAHVEMLHEVGNVQARLDFLQRARHRMCRYL
jgi:hypothetical protein